MAEIEKTTEDVWGKEVRKLVACGRNAGIGAGTEDGDLPRAAGNKYAQFVTTLKNLYGVIEISDKAIRASENNSGAFVSLLNAEMEGLIKSSTYNFGRMLFGDGTGTLATVSSNIGVIMEVDNAQNLYEGMIVDIHDNMNTLVVEGAVIKKIYGNSIEFYDLPLEAPAGSKIVLQGSFGNELTGLKAIFTYSPVLYGLKRDDYSCLSPTVQNSVGEITEEKIQTMLDTIEEKSGSQPNFIICSWGVRRALMKLFSQNKRVIDTVELKGGFKAMSYNGIPIVVDRFCPSGTMYLLNTNHFSLHQLCDWEWLQADDGSVLKQVAGKPVYTATLVKYAELMCSCPCGQGMLSGITEG